MMSIPKTPLVDRTDDDAIVIVGGGAIGCATAFFLTQRQPPARRVIVIERDPTYAQASSARSASSIRQQFSTPVNIALSRFGFAFLRDAARALAVAGEVPPAMGLREGGYLYLATTDAGAATLRANHATQQAHGADIALLGADALHARLPWLHTRDVRLAALGLAGEGWFDGYALLQALRRKAQAQGARFVHGEAVGFELDRPVSAAAPAPHADAGADEATTVRAVTLADGTTLRCATVINAAGAWSARVAAWAGIAALPVRGKRRTVFHVSCPTPVPDCPLIVDPSGVWLRPEGRHFLCGYTPSADEDAEDFAPLDQPPLDAFERTVWPALAHRVPAFEALRVESAWCGYYEMNTFDHNGLVGLHPRCTNLVFATGFSGHGLQHAPGIGRGVAELIVDGGWPSLDLSPLATARLVREERVVEANVI